MTGELNSILRVPEFRSRFERLKKQIRNSPETVVPWIGAGMSKPFGLPLWREFLDIAADQLTTDDRVAFEQLSSLDQIDLALVAEFLHSRLKGRLRKCVVDLFNTTQRWNPEECTIPWLGVRAAITTNYDRILDSHLPWLTPVSATAAYSDFRGHRCLIKLHGRVEEPDSVVLTRSQYVRAYSDRFWKWLEQFSYNNTLLFLGCSLSGDDFLEVLKPGRSEEAPRHFAIIPTQSDAESRRRSDHLLGSYGIETISYDPSTHGHGVVKDLLLALIPPLAVAKRQAQVVTSEAELELAWKNYCDASQVGAHRKEKVDYLIAVLGGDSLAFESSEIRKDVFEALLEFWEDEGAWVALLEAARGSKELTSRVLQQRDRLRPQFDENTETLPETKSPPVRNYYRAFRAGDHKEAAKWLSVLQMRAGSEADRIRVLTLQNDLLRGNLNEGMVEEYEKSLSNDGRYLYLDYGLGLYYLWKGELDRARSSFKAAREPWPRGRSAFISWQEAICAILAGDLMSARVNLEAVAVGAFLPLGPAGKLIERSGGTELSFEPRRTTSKELYCLVWFFRSLAARATKQSDEASERHDSTTHLIGAIQGDDLLLSWLLYADRLLAGKPSEALRIELEHRTRRNPGSRVLLNAASICLLEISKEAGVKFSASVDAVAGSTDSHIP